MTDIVGEVVRADGEVTPGETAVIKVEADNLRGEPPTLRQGNCRASTLNQGEKVKFNLTVINSDGDVVRQAESPTLCLPYKFIGKGIKSHTFELTMHDLGSYTVDINLKGFRDLVDITNGVDSFGLDVVGEHAGPGNGDGDNGDDNNDGNNNNGNKFDLVQTAIENPIGTVVVLGVGGVAINKATDFGG